MLTGKIPDHPSPFTTKRVGDAPPIIDVIAYMLESLPLELLVFDPYAGQGRVLGELCADVGRRVDGIEIELDPALGGSYPNTAPWVRFGDALEPLSYPAEPFVVVTSPPYTNRISIDYRSGPTPTTKRNGRLSYGISLGRALHPRNLARKVDRNGSEAFHAELGAAMKLWGEHAIVNVDAPMCDRCLGDLSDAGYTSVVIVDVATPRARGFANSSATDRADHEVVIAAARS